MVCARQERRPDLPGRRDRGLVTQPATPTTTGKIERFPPTLRRELLDDVATWPDLDSVQAAIDAFRHEYNTDRPHRSLDGSWAWLVAAAAG